jgi:undecaprenyl pyrophosphate phosphatase UppP
MNNQTVAVWLLILLAVAAANLPFMNERLFGLFRLKKVAVKPPWLVVVEVLTYFVFTIVIGLVFEKTLSNPFPNTMTLVTIGFCIFLVLGYPGFVFRYLLKRKLATKSYELPEE